MEQHPIPQNISSYQFRLIGDMTLRQFLLLMAWMGVGGLFYLTNLPGLIKWFFIAVCIIAGVGFAFLPLEGRPLDQWLMAFIKTIYHPTQFHWKKSSSVPDYLKNQAKKTPSAQIKTKEKKQKPTPLAASKSKSQDQLTPSEEVISKKDQEKLDQINTLFSEDQTKKTTPPPTSRETPQPPASSSQNFVPTIQTQTIKPVKINKEARTTKEAPLKKTLPKSPQPSFSGTITPKPDEKPHQKAFFNPNLPFPGLTETPNTLSGMIFDRSGKILENVVIEIKDAQQNTARATKTNKLGQFTLTTPLENGSYTLEFEKPDHSFDIISLALEGKIYPPLEIRSK
ncbi:carboxypeptidase regulatory-like domain-containing protein [Patescibacteria group bacterium]